MSAGSDAGRDALPGARTGPGPLADVRVLDLATVLAGPTCARYLADFGADVIKVERPTGDTWRNVGWSDPDDGVSLWWKYTNRNKRTIALDLKDDADRQVLLDLVADAHVLIENFRPGTLERLGLSPDTLWAINPNLVVVRVTGFGQDGPYANRPGFASIAEAMMGYASINGEVGGDPMIPPIALTDEVTALVAAFATMVALHAGIGQVVDVNLIESMFHLMGPLVGAWRKLGYVQPRAGSAIPYTVPRGVYTSADGRHLVVSSSSDSVAQRVMQLVGAGDDPRFATFASRVEHRDACDRLVRDWIAARTGDEVVAAFEQAEAAVAPVLTIPEMDIDPHVVARGIVAELDGVAMQGLVARFSATPGSLRWAGRPIDADGPAIRADGWASPAS